MNMKLHEEFALSNGLGLDRILKVPDGWIYTFILETGTGGYSMSSCFVSNPQGSDHDCGYRIHEVTGQPYKKNPKTLKLGPY